MCNLYSNTVPVEAMRRLFEVDAEADRLGNQPPLPAIYPRHEAPVVRLNADGQHELLRMHWGFLLPQKSKKTGEPVLPRAVNNARDDKVRSSPFWRSSFETRRCLIPATSFCEAKGKRPATYYWFAVKDGEPREPFAFAGLWRRFRGAYRDGELVDIETYTMLTTRPNHVVAAIHPDRMPVILDPKDYQDWLSAAPDTAFDLIKQWPAEMTHIVIEGDGAKADPT